MKKGSQWLNKQLDKNSKIKNQVHINTREGENNKEKD
jgi:hypothetical protein